MKVLFHTNTLNYRGTTVAVTDYARYNQQVLGNESVIAYCKSLGYEKDMGSESQVIQELQKEFQVIGYSSGELVKDIDKEKIDLAYFIKSGQRDNSDLPTNCKTAVHAVFQYCEPHGDRYAYISRWLSERMSNGTIPFVPHIVDLPEPTGNLRDQLGIASDKTIIGRIGGYYTFDIPAVQELIASMVEKSDKFVFVFVGTQPFIDHPQVKFVSEIYSPQIKSNFINTCHAMIHARARGESFGLSIAEFLSLGKPVLAWSGGQDLNHTELLRGSGTLYNNLQDLYYLLNNVHDLNQDWRKRVEEFKPLPVMRKFQTVFYN